MSTTKPTKPTLIRISAEAKRWLIAKAGGPRKLGRYIELCAAYDRARQTNTRKAKK